MLSMIDNVNMQSISGFSRVLIGKIKYDRKLVYLGYFRNRKSEDITIFLFTLCQLTRYKLNVFMFLLLKAVLFWSMILLCLKIIRLSCPK